MQDGKINPVVGIFWQKNYDGLRDQTELAIAPTNPLGDGKSAEELAKKNSDDAYIDAEEQKALPDKQKGVSDWDPLRCPERERIAKRRYCKLKKNSLMLIPLPYADKQ